MSPGGAVQIQPFVGSPIINILAQCHRSSVFVSVYDALGRFVCRYWC